MKAYTQPDVCVLSIPRADLLTASPGIPAFEGDYALPMPGFWEDKLG